MAADGDIGEDSLGHVDATETPGSPTETAPATIQVPTGARTDATTTGRARWGIFLGVAAAVIVADQLSKAWLVANVSVADPPVQVIGDLVRLVQSQNSGALFGLFRDQAIIFALVSIGVIGLIAVYHARAGRSAYLSLALGLLLGGAIGNMIDRLRLGYVVDWVDIGLGSLRFWTFNVADSAITIAILMLLAAAVVPALAGGSRGGADA